jgi:syntaxin 16
LAQIFKDLQTLVIHQGTILDRIDWNIEQTDHNVIDGNKHLKKGKEYQSSSRNKMCIILLCVAILIMILVIILKIYLGF